MLNRFEVQGRRLIENGYLVVPIVPGEKRPAGTDWPNARYTVADVGRYAAHGVGVLTGQGAKPVVAIDIDVSHPVIGPALIAWCTDNIGETFQRIGAAPRTLLAYRAAAAGWSKQMSVAFFDESDPVKVNGEKNRQRVEVLAHGQQFVAYHTHPDTGKPYEWPDLFGGIEYVHVNELPVVTHEQIDALMAEVARLVDCVDSLQLLDAASSGGDRAVVDPDARALTLAGVTAETVADVRAAMQYLKPLADDYNSWYANLLRLKSLAQAGFPLEAKEIAREFSASSAKHSDAEFERKWAKLNPDTVTYKSLFNPATAAGWVNPRKAKVDPHRPDGGRVDMTDAGNVNVLFEKTDGDLRYIVDLALWMWWDGCTWSVCKSGATARDAALQVAEMWLVRAKDVEADAEKASGDDRKRLLKIGESYRAWVAKCRNRNGLDNLLSSAARDPRFAVSVAQLDQDRWALGVANGVVDLRTGQLRGSGREDLITKRSPYNFNPEAPAARFEHLVDEVTALPDGPRNAIMRPAYAAYLRRAIGYWATGAVNEHKMFPVSGAGSNGKSVLFDVLAEVLGPYCVQIPPAAMMATSQNLDGERPTPFARSLAGARLAFGSEAREGQKLNAAWVKQQTGDAKLTARGMRENAFTFSVTHKLALLTNHEPSLDHMDEATRGRIHVLPFDRRWNRPGLPSRDPSLPDGDKHLMSSLMAEAEGILAAIVRGAVSYAAEGLEPPPEVAAKTLAYFEQQDPFAQWLQTMERCAAKLGTAASTLFGQFKSWCMAEGVQNPSPASPHAFAKALDAAGIEKARTTSGAVWGLQLSGVVEF